MKSVPNFRRLVLGCIRAENKAEYIFIHFNKTEGMHSEQWLETYLDKWRGYDQEISFDTNVLVLDHNCILFSREIPELFAYLKQYEIDCDYVPIRHGTYWEAGIHCLTLDVSRAGLRRKIF